MKYLVLVAMLVLGVASFALADGFSMPSISTTEWVAAATAIIGAYCAIWGLKRVFGVVKR